MSSAIVVKDREAFGSVAWVERTGGHMSHAERWSLVPGLFLALVEGLRLWRAAKNSGRRGVALDAFEPPSTPMVSAARAYLLAHSETPMANHCHRTAFWTCMVLNQHIEEVPPKDIETAWVAALLHDVGLDVPSDHGDFTRRGVEVVEALAHEHGWPEEQTHFASEAIATNLSARVDKERSGMVAWAMNVGGLGEVGFGPHRTQLSSDRVAELEARYPRTGFREAATRLIAEETKRLPDGRFAFFRHIFPFLLKD